MGHYSAVGVLTFGVCLFVFLSATANGTIENPTEVTEGEANQGVETAKTSTTKVFKKAKEELSNANSALARVKALETEVCKIEVLGGEAEAKVAKEVKDNKDAKTIVDKIKNVFNTVSDLYRNATGDLENAISCLTKLRNNGEALETECSTAALVITDAKDNIKVVNDKAVEIKGKADTLENDIDDASKIITRVDSTEKNMMKGLKDAQLANLHVSAIVSVAKIQTMMEEADGIIEKTKEQNDEIKDIVQQMKELKRTAKGGLIESCDALFQKANDDSSNVSGALNDANQAKTEITRQKGLADTALTNVPKQSEVTEAQKELAKVEACVKECNGIVAQLKRGLLTAENSVRNAKTLKQQMVTALSTTTNAVRAEQTTETEKANPVVEQVTEPDQKDTTIQPTSKKLLSQSNKSAEEIKSALTKVTQNVATTALTGGKAPAPGANNDSAMTVSVPLLVALIASAVWQ